VLNFLAALVFISLSKRILLHGVREDNVIKMDLKDIGCVDVDWIHTADDGSSFGSREHGNGYSIRINGGDFSTS
jgi:hypothetical protein